MRKHAAILATALLLLSLFASQDITRAAPVRAANQVPDVECYPWAKAEGWTSTRCFDYANGDVCIFSSSGMHSCKFEGD